ncbi:DUF2752 domain-containing protein [Crocinitomicaceae bacterium]|nr:DUF2752 domain-containing protein [Crocinitomicaceae bacterium]
MKRLLHGGIVLFLTTWLVLLYNVDPVQHESYPKCMVKKTTGLDCPGCGSSRSARHLVYFEFAESFQQNPLAFITLPLLWTYSFLIMIGVAADDFLKRVLPDKVYLRFSLLVLIVVIVFTILRNLL